MKIVGYTEQLSLIRITVELDDGTVREVEIAEDTTRAADLDLRAMRPEVNEDAEWYRNRCVELEKQLEESRG